MPPDASFETDPDSGVPLIGGEMPDWTDRPSCSPLLASVIRSAVPEQPGRVLLLGPRAAALHTMFPGAQVVIRGLADARELHSADVGVLCGSLRRVRPDAFDLAICLDPPQRLLSPDDDGMGHLEVIDAVRALAPASLVAVQGGTPLRTHNAIHSLAENSAWWVDQDGYDVRPPSLSVVRSALGSDQVASLLPSITFTRAVKPVAEAVTARVRAAFGDRPEWLSALDAGVGDEVAGAWLVAQGLELPGGASTSPIAAEGPDVIHSAAPPTASSGPLLEPALRRHLAAGTLHRVRPLLDSYLDWLADLDPATRPFALVRNTIHRDEHTFELVETGWRLREGSIHLTDDTVVTALAMVDFADSLVEQPGSHPFGADSSADDVARSLLRLTGRPDRFVTDGRELQGRLGILERPVWHDPHDPERTDELQHQLTTAHHEIHALQTQLAAAQRRNRALEHALATEGGTRARRAFYLMTTPTSRLVEAARSRVTRGKPREK